MEAEGVYDIQWRGGPLPSPPSQDQHKSCILSQLEGWNMMMSPHGTPHHLWMSFQTPIYSLLQAKPKNGSKWDTEVLRDFLAIPFRSLHQDSEALERSAFW